MKKLNYVFAVAIASALQSPSAWSADNFLPDIQQQGDVYYVTGGIGDEETDAMETERGDYNLQIMSADRLGHFNGYPHIIISDMQHNELINADGGPLFYASLPNGKYIVEGFVGKQTQRQNITITGKKTSYIRFVWK